MKVMGRSTIETVDVRADGTGLSSRAGTALLALMAQRLGLTDGLCGALAGTRERRSGHDPGRVLCDLAVMAADGGHCVSDLAALAGPACAVRESRVGFDRAAGAALDRGGGARPIRQARASRARGRGRRARPGAGDPRLRRDADRLHSEKERAAGHYKGGFGFNPLLVSCGREVLAGILRPGNAGANNADDHLSVLELALEQLPHSALDGEILARSDSAGASHEFAFACRGDRHPLLARLRDQRAGPRGDPRAARDAPGSRRWTGKASRARAPGSPS